MYRIRHAWCCSLVGLALCGCSDGRSGIANGQPETDASPTATEPTDGHAAESSAKTNGLSGESSPYLLQHAKNPVDWLPWNAEAFKLAKEQNRLIFVSVGYSSCHWCRVMENESFEDEAVAKLLNDNFICIKVDREEMPDVDRALMNATQLHGRITTGRASGGWPNSVWMTPDRRPFFCGTYFPKPQFMQVSRQLSETWRTRADAIGQRANQLRAAIAELSADPASPDDAVAIDWELVHRAARASVLGYDEVWGGFGNSQKFPPHTRLLLLLQLQEKEQMPPELEQVPNVVQGTLDAIIRGGIHDQLGGGFHRYSVDRRWRVPHFEKMLDDNALLLLALAKLNKQTGDPSFRNAAAGIVSWFQREMIDKQGGFCTSLDADTDGVEGATYVWKLGEIEKILGQEKAAQFAAAYGVTVAGEASLAHASGRGMNVLGETEAMESLAKAASVTRAEFREQLAPGRRVLFEARQKRPAPRLDDKVITAWNGMTIYALARSGGMLDEPTWTDLAARAASFVLASSRDADGHLQRYFRDGTTRNDAYLDDHAWLLLGVLELHRQTGDENWIKEAVALADGIIDSFYDAEGGGFFASRKGVQRFVEVLKPIEDSTHPSPNGVACMALLRTSQLTGDEKYFVPAEKTLRSYAKALSDSPLAHLGLAMAAAELLSLPDSAAPNP
ncbi:MAG: thioredoxin domain-containing protein [Aeoliella sp.]